MRNEEFGEWRSMGVEASRQSSVQSLRYSQSVEIDVRGGGGKVERGYWKEEEELEEEGINFYEDVLDDFESNEAECKRGEEEKHGFQREFSIEQLRPESEEGNDSSEEEQSEGKMGESMKESATLEPDEGKEEIQVPEVRLKKLEFKTIDEKKESEKRTEEEANEMRETIRYLVKELQSAKKLIDQMDNSARSSWEEGRLYGRDQLGRELKDMASNYDEESMVKEISGLRKMLEDSEVVRKELQSRLVAVTKEFDKKVEEVKEKMQERANSKENVLERRVQEAEMTIAALKKENKEIGEENRQLKGENSILKHTNEQLSIKNSKQIKYKKSLIEESPINPAQKFSRPILSQEYTPPMTRSRSPVQSKPSPSHESEIKKLEAENKKLKDHLRLVLQSPKNTNVSSSIVSTSVQGPLPDVNLLTAQLLKIDPSLLIVQINDTTIEVNKKRVVLIWQNGKTMVKGKYTYLTISEYLENFHKR